jgi:hypothetical protein
MKNIGQAAFGLALVLFMTGCAAILQNPGAEKTGMVTFTISGGERTALPSIDQFEKITLSFAAKNGSPAVADQDATGGSVAVELPLGSWDVTAKAYIGETDTSPAATAQNTIGYDGTDITGETRFILVAVGTGEGTLQYSVVVPGGVTLAGSGSQIRIEQNGAALEDLDGDGFTDGAHGISGSETDISVSLDGGRYVASIALEDDSGNTAIFRESVAILPGLVTKIGFAPAAADFLSPAERAALPDMGSVTFAGTSFNSGITVGSLEVDGQDYTLAIEAEDGTETLYFTLSKPAGYTVSLGANAAGTAVFDTFENGPAASDELVVIKVDTSSVVEGGDVAFTLTVAETGKTGVDITVTATVAASGGPGLYVATEGNGKEILTRVEDSNIAGLETALIWLAANAADDTDYVVLIGEDSELHSSYVSKSGSSNVKVTLRGIDTEQKIYWDSNGTTSGRGVFNLDLGTTLALGENVTFYGNNSSNHPPVAGLYGGSFEMLPGSKITNVTTMKLITAILGYLSGGGYQPSAVILRGGTITNNTVSMNIISGDAVVPLRVEMHDGAAITGNTIRNPSLTPIETTKLEYIFGKVAAVALNYGGTFIMHGGEISYNSVRGVYMTYLNDPETSWPITKLADAVFDMRGGKIHHNGNDAIPLGATDYYALAAGVFINDASGSFTMTGGEISDNGSSNSALPNSGIYLNCRTPTLAGISNNIVLDGTVGIKNNKVSISGVSANPTPLYLGNNFTTADPIEVVLVIASATSSNLQSYWNGKQLLASLPQDGLTIDAASVGKFSLAGHYFMTTSGTASPSNVCYAISGYTSKIADGTDQATVGSIVVTAD